MLTKITPVTSNGSSTIKQIAVSTNTANAIYTVPTGKTFTGYVTSWSTGAGVTVNGVSVYCTGGTGGFASGLIPLTLVAGTVVAGLSQAGALIGTEQ